MGVEKLVVTGIDRDNERGLLEHSTRETASDYTGEGAIGTREKYV